MKRFIQSIPTPLWTFIAGFIAGIVFSNLS